jgi:hypothetical protein
MKIFTNKEIWIWILASLLVINIAITATMFLQKRGFDQIPPTARDMHDTLKGKTSHSGFSKWREKMGFSEDQERELKKLRNEFKSESASIFEKLHENQQYIFTELNDEFPDPTRLDSLIKETGQLHSEMRKASVEYMLSLRDVTNEEQYLKMLEMMKEWMFRDPTAKHQHWQHKGGKSYNDDSCRENRD